MKFSATKTLLAVLLTSTVAFSAANAAEEANVTLTPVQLQAHQLVDATNWVQTSGEYRALAYQAFNFAKLAFAVKQADEGQVKVVVADLDETLVDNSAYQGALIKEGAAFSSSTWGEWEKQGNPTALPGAIEFTRFVNSNGGKMVYVSNRSDKNKAATMETLRKLGFPGVSEETVLLKAETSNKNPRFEQAAKLGTVVLYMGDNLNDFPGVYSIKDSEGRRAWANQNAANFGTKYVVLPNPMYGNWMSSLAKDFYGLSATEQNNVRVDTLKAWADFPKK